MAGGFWSNDGQISGSSFPWDMGIELSMTASSDQACRKKKHTLWLFNIAMENGPFIDGLAGFTY